MPPVATPHRARRARPITGVVIQGDERRAVAPPRPDRVDTPAGACDLIARAFCGPADGPDAWLADLADAIASPLGDDVGAQAMLVIPPRGRLRWMADAVALSPGYPHAAARALRTEAMAGWPASGNDAVTIGCAPLVAPIAVTWDDVARRATSALPARRRLGLHRFLRAAAPLWHPAGPRGMLVQLDGLSPAWSPTPQLLDAALAVIGPLATAYASRFTARQSAQRRILNRLSDRQRGILPLLVDGVSEPTIARRLGRSVHTVHDHTKQIYRRLGVSSRFELRDLWLGHADASSRATPAQARVHC